MITVPARPVNWPISMGRSSVILALPTGTFGDIGLNRRFLPWLVLEIGTFVIAYVIWLVSGTGKPLCRPDSWFQGHAAWQILGALAAGFLYLNLLAETLS